MNNERIFGIKKKVTQNKEENKTKTPKDPTKRNKYRRMMKGRHNAKFLRRLRRKIANKLLYA